MSPGGGYGTLTKTLAQRGDEALRAGSGLWGKLSGGIRKLFGGACSFSADTVVATPDGEVPISELRVGDTVLA